MKMNFERKIILFAILLLAGGLRLYSLNWDQGFHLHPDERAIIMTVAQLDWPVNLTTLLSPESPWNTNFFAYGSFPFYLLKISGEALGLINPDFGTYALIAMVGRTISAIFDLFSVFLVFLIGRKLFGELAGYLGALFYTLSVLPIQLAHFYAVDTLLTFFLLGTLYKLIIFHEKPGIRGAVAVGVFAGLAMATKISAVIIFIPILLHFAICFRTIIIRKMKKIKSSTSDSPALLKKTLSQLVFLIAAGFIVYAICSPYTFIAFDEFKRQTLAQSQMTSNAFIFPYTLQYVGKLPYLYEIKNIFLWGLGPVLGIITFSGLAYFIITLFHKNRYERVFPKLVIFIFFIAYFWVVGKFAIGFMRYMLPLYPLLCVFGGLIASKAIYLLRLRVKNSIPVYAIYFIIYIVLLIWPMSFINIYSSPNTRVTATKWILDNVPYGKTLAQEHWDDPVPLSGSEKYSIVTLPLYDPDIQSKWDNINQLLEKTDYIIIASNRLYTPLQKLTDCESLPIGKCYPLTSKYYERLFSGQAGFQQIAQFTSFPVIPIINLPINDQAADESFTVYDHPKIMIFQRLNPSM